MSSRKARRSFSAEFKADAVKLCKVGDRSISKVALDLGITESALRRWVDQSQAFVPLPSSLSTSERDELLRLRRDNLRLQMERDILKKATAFFARESE